MRSLKKTIVLKVDPRCPGKEAIAQAAEVLRSGGLAAFPTETVYGLGANALDDNAVARLREVKKRPEGKPFTVHIDDIGLIEKSGCEITPAARFLIDRYWPGPLTLILKGKDGRNTGFRMPDNAVARKLIKMAGIPIFAPSANISGQTPPTTPGDVLKQLDGQIEILLDAGPTDVGVESTVLDMTAGLPKVLREGAIGKKAIYKLLKIDE